MQDKTAIFLYRTAKHDGLADRSVNLQFHVQSLQQVIDGDVHRFVDDDAERAAFVVFAEIYDTATEDRIMHRWHCDQEMVG